MKRLVVFAVFIGTASILLGTEPSPYEIGCVDGRVKIDGILDDDAWKYAQPVPGFVEIESGAAPLYPVQAGMLWDSSNLYVGFAVADTNVWAFKTIRDDPMANRDVGVISCISNIPSGKGGWGKYVENFVKVYLDPDSDGRNYIEMHVNPLNKVCDKWQTAPWKQDVRERMGIEGDAVAHPEWNCPGLVTCTHTYGSLNDTGYGDYGWTVEMAIPFSSIRDVCGDCVNAPPRTGDVWNVHLGRRYRADPETEKVDYWTWPVIGRRDCHTPDKWAKAVFAGAKETDQASASFLNPWPVSNEIHNAAGFVALKKADFKWKGLWIRPVITVEEIDRMIDLADGMGFNAIVVAAAHSGGRSYYDSEIIAKPKNVKIDPLKEIVERAHAKGIEVYAWTCNLMCEPVAYMKEHPELLQVIRPWEEEAAHLARANPDRANAHRGDWLCPDRGLNELEKRILTELMTGYDLDGIGLDYLGYRNYYGCFCDYSMQKRAEYAKQHPEFTEKEIMRGFSEESLVSWTREVREHVLSLKKDAKLVIHIYPDFDLEPEYGSKLPVEYCAQTVSWFYSPLWSSIKCKQCCEMYAASDAKEDQFDNFVPFVGIIDAKDRSTNPEQFRQYLRIAGESGSDSVIVAFYKTLLSNTNLVTVAREELGGKTGAK